MHTGAVLAAAQDHRLCVRPVTLPVLACWQVTRVQLLPAVRNRRVQRHSAPVCVNACYTSAIHGDAEHPERLASIMRTEKLGACGHVHSVSTIFGVLELFRKRRGECMVIGKA